MYKNELKKWVKIHSDTSELQQLRYVMGDSRRS